MCDTLHIYIYIKYVRYMGENTGRNYEKGPSSRKIGMDDHQLEAMAKRVRRKEVNVPPGARGLALSIRDESKNETLAWTRRETDVAKKRSKRLVGRTRRVLLTRLKRDASRRSRNDIQRDEGRIENGEATDDAGSVSTDG